METNGKRKLEEDFFTNLPLEIMIDILSRLPLRTIMNCMCVCKPFLNLIKTPGFAESHFSTSVPCLAYEDLTNSKSYKIIELVDTQRPGQNQNHCDVVLKFSFPNQALLHSSANGLLFLYNPIQLPSICNPITREQISLPPPPEGASAFEYLNQNKFGFGVSKSSGEYKIVRIFHQGKAAQCNCEVYTVGTGWWRSIATRGPLKFDEQINLPVFSNGNLHWLIGAYTKSSDIRRILCFDLETECFSTFSVPSLDDNFEGINLCALGDFLCFYSNCSDGVLLWLMDKYGDDKSWRREFVFGEELGGSALPIKIFRDGGILFVDKYIPKLYCYSRRAKTIRQINLPEPSEKWFLGPKIYTLSFLPVSLRALMIKSVTTF